MKIGTLFQSLLIIALLFLTACNSTEHKTIKTGQKATLKETLDTAIDANISSNEAGMIMSVWQDGEVLYTGQKGLAKSGTEINSHTGFRLASVSKTFTAIAILKLYEQGLIDLQDSILKYLPQLDTSWRDITIHHLLSHQSGIPDFANDFDDKKILPNGLTNANVVDYFVRNPRLEFSPGSSSDYSNTGYVLLAEIVAEVSQGTFSDFMDNEIFHLYSMEESYVVDEDSDILATAAMNHAYTYDLFNRGFYATGTAGQVSSMTDMLTFFSAFVQGEVLHPETQKLMMTQYASPVFLGYGYGVGFFNDELTVYGHTGGNDGFRTMYVVNKNKNAMIILLGNGGNKLPDFNYLVDLAGEFIQ